MQGKPEKQNCFGCGGYSDVPEIRGKKTNKLGECERKIQVMVERECKLA